jgi:hypothetical protein
LGRRKDPRELKTIGAPQRNYINHQAKRRCEISLTLFYYCFNYNTLHVYQCIILRYQCIESIGVSITLYVSMYQTLCINARINK